MSFNSSELPDPKEPSELEDYDLNLSTAIELEKEFQDRPLTMLELKDQYQPVTRGVPGGVSNTWVVQEKNGAQRYLLLKLPRNYFAFVDKQGHQNLASADIQKEILDQYRREARLLSMHRCCFPYLVCAELEDDGIPWLVIELITFSGNYDPTKPLVQQIHNLRSACEHLKLNVTERIKLVKKAAIAIAAVHREGITHADVKPENLMVRRDASGDYEVILIDMGFARVPGAFLLGVREVSSGYTEGYTYSDDSHQISRSIDIYALGVTLRDMVLECADLGPGRRQEILDIVAKATHRLPSVQYESASQFADELDRYLSHQAIAARRSPFYVTKKWLQKNRFLFAVVFFASMLVALAFFAYGFQQNRDLALRLETSNAQLELKSKVAAENAEKAELGKQQAEAARALAQDYLIEVQKAEAQTRLERDAARRSSDEVNNLLLLIKRELLGLELVSSGRDLFAFPNTIFGIDPFHDQFVQVIGEHLRKILAPRTGSVPAMELLLAAGIAVAPIEPQVATGILDSLQCDPDSEMDRVKALALAACRIFKIVLRPTDLGAEIVEELDVANSDLRRSGFLVASPSTDAERYAEYLNLVRESILGNQSKATESLERLIKFKNPNPTKFDVNMLVAAGDVYSELNQLEDSVRIYGQALAIINTNFPELANLRVVVSVRKANLLFQLNAQNWMETYGVWNQAYQEIRKLHGHAEGELCADELEMKLSQAETMYGVGVLQSDAGMLNAVAHICDETLKVLGNPTNDRFAWIQMRCWLQKTYVTIGMLGRQFPTQPATREVLAQDLFDKATQLARLLNDEGVLSEIRLLKELNRGRVRELSEIEVELAPFGDLTTLEIDESQLAKWWRILLELYSKPEPQRRMPVRLVLEALTRHYRSTGQEKLPESMFCQTVLGLLLTDMDEWQLAIEPLKAGMGLQMIRLNDRFIGDSERLMALGRCQLQLGQPKEALNSLTSATLIRRQPNYPEWQLRLALMYQGQAFIESQIDPTRGMAAIRDALSNQDSWWPKNLPELHQNKLKELLKEVSAKYLDKT